MEVREWIQLACTFSFTFPLFFPAWNTDVMTEEELWGDKLENKNHMLQIAEQKKTEIA